MCAAEETVCTHNGINDEPINIPKEEALDIQPFIYESSDTDSLYTGRTEEGGNGFSAHL